MRLAVGGGGCGCIPWNFKSFALDLRPKFMITCAMQCAMKWLVLRSHRELSRHVSASRSSAERDFAHCPFTMCQA